MRLELWNAFFRINLQNLIVIHLESLWQRGLRKLSLMIAETVPSIFAFENFKFIQY